MSKEELEVQLIGTPGISPEAADKYRELINKHNGKLKRYKDEKDNIMQEALAIGKAKGKS